MKLRRTWFLAASARSSASAAASLTGSGNSIAWRRAMERGTMLSISARREVSPLTDSIRAWSSASMPIWRGRGGGGGGGRVWGGGGGHGWGYGGAGIRWRFPVRRAVRDAAQQMASAWGGLEEGVTGSGGFGVVGVAGRVEQRIELAGIAEPDLEEPAGAERVGVGQRRVGAQALVDGGDLARDRHVHVGCRLHGFDHAGDFALRKMPADFGQVDEHHVAERILGVHGDADHGGSGVGGIDPFMVFGKFDGHRRLSGRKRKKSTISGSSSPARRAWHAPASARPCRARWPARACLARQRRG